MKITKIVYTRKYNLGGYESHDISLEAEVQDDDSPQAVLTSLANVASDWHLSQKREAAPQPVKTPAQLANEEYTRTHPQTVTWQNMPPTQKGDWQKTTDITNPMLTPLIHKIEAEHKAVDEPDGYRYWLMKKGDIIEAVARRK